jgi:acyl-coenzyme A synthetase/AMP-(fatty) acid ligase
VSYTKFTPAEILSLGFTAPEITDQAWCVNWSGTDPDVEDLVLRTLPETIDFHTSGSTGPSQCWRRIREDVWLEAGMLAELLEPERPQAIVSFVPPVHLYGALASVLVPAHLGVPVWYRPKVLGMMPAIAQRRVVVVATPWIFSVLLEHMTWVHAMEHITVLHGGAMLPAAAGDFLVEAGEDRALIVEVLGSTEAGAVATRRWRAGEPPAWTLFRDVSFAMPASAADGELPLVVRSPRLAFRPDSQAPELWEMDDHVQPVDNRRFRFAGRRSRLVKVNGRRINLDELEHSLRAVVNCADLAIMPLADRMVGEHIDLLIVPEPGDTLADIDLYAVISHIGIRPRRVHAVARIDRSETGKLRHVQASLTTDAGLAT